MTAKGIISEKEWDSGTSAQGVGEKAGAILVYLRKLEDGTGASMKAIASGTKIKWPYSTVIAMVKQGTLEEKKAGKAKYYRIKGQRKAKKAK